MEMIPARRCGLIHTDLLADVSISPALGDMYSGVVQAHTRPVRSFGIMETTVNSEVPVRPVGDFGDIPIGPARSSGDIYATGAVGQTGGTQIVVVIGDMYAGVWAGQMPAGPSVASGHMETT
jgi:hypothetical protein